MKTHKTVRVRSCYMCPLRTIDGAPGSVMICDHPKWTPGTYEGAIITHENLGGIPEKCPLKENDYEIKYSIKNGEDE